MKKTIQQAVFHCKGGNFYFDKFLNRFVEYNLNSYIPIVTEEVFTDICPCHGNPFCNGYLKIHTQLYQN